MACHDKYWGLNLRHIKTYDVTKKMDYHENLWHLVANDMSCYHHMEDRITMNCKEQQYFQLANKWNKFIKSWYELWHAVSVTNH
jgi:hypothetical protein